MDRHEEGLGKYPYVDLAQVKSYLSINSDTHDGTLANIINYALIIFLTTVIYSVLHRIGIF